jgi:hypothetical protein
MRFFHIGKDGGPKSTVTGYWLVELKKLFSVALLRFDDGSRDEYHSHAFDCISWVLKGRLREQHLNYPAETQGREQVHRPSLLPVITLRTTFHRVVSEGTTWVFTIRGPWAKVWKEFNPATKVFSTLENGRKMVGQSYRVSSY